MFHKRHPPRGARPGTLVVNGDAPHPQIRVIDYDPETHHDAAVAAVDDLHVHLDRPTVTWVDVQGMGSEEVLWQLATVFGIHPLAMEDVVNAPQRPKAETFDDHLLFITRMARVGADGTTIEREQVSIFVGANYVLTFQERPGDVFEPVRRRIREGKGPIRGAGAPYLAYALLDAVVDAYYPVVEAIGETLDELEDEVVARPTRATLRAIYDIKREMLAFRRAVWPQREAINAILRGDHGFMNGDVQVYLRDVYDHCVQVLDVLENYREMAGGLLDVYLSSVSNRTNDVMKVLTIMASIFIPLTFIAGIYGMNFDNMPELHYTLGYPLVLGAMFVVAFGMVLFFVRKGWLGEKREEAPEERDQDRRRRT